MMAGGRPANFLGAAASAGAHNAGFAANGLQVAVQAMEPSLAKTIFRRTHGCILATGLRNLGKVKATATEEDIDAMPMVNHKAGHSLSAEKPA